MHQIKNLWLDYKLYQNNLYKSYKMALITLNETYKEMGKREINIIKQISKIQFKPFIDIKYKKNLGILLPHIEYELIQEEQLPPYSFENTSHHLDELIILLKDFFKYIVLYAEKEDILLSLVFNFKKISRRINGLKNVIKPQLESDIKVIKEILEELDRENFVRLKKTKNLIKN